MKQSKKIFVIGVMASVSLLALVHFHNVLAAGSALENLAASMQPGTWAELATTNITNTLGNTGGASGSSILYSDTGVWDPVSKRFFFIGGDHNSSTGCPRFVSFTDSTSAWQILQETGSWSATWSPCGGTPIHGYDHLSIDTSKGKLYFRPYNDPVVRKYDLATQKWSDLPAIPSSAIQYISVAVGTVWFPERNSLVYASIDSGTNGAVAEYSETTGSWTRIAGSLPMGPYHNFAKYDPIHKVVLFGGGNSDNHMYKLDASGNVTAMKLAPIPVGVMESVISVDPATGKFLVFGNSNNFYIYDITTDTWQLQSSAGVPLFGGSVYSPPIAGIIASPLSSYGVTMFTRCYVNDCHVYLYKYSGSATAPPPSPTDTTAPTVSISSPASGSTVSGTTTITASASDNVGVAGVQFKLDGNNLGSEDVSSPFSISWDTTTAANGTHSLTAVARDAAGNQTTSAAVSVNVSNTAPTSPPSSSGSSDFSTRCSAAGVVRCVGFDQASDIAGGYGSNTGIFSGASTPQLDSTVSASGSSLKMTIPSNSPADTSGSYFANFSPDLSVQFGEHSEFYVQWRQRFSPEFVSTQYAGGGGWKQSIIGEGDRPGVWNASCTQLEVVTQNTYQRGFPQQYHSCGQKDGTYEPLEEPYGSYDFKLENGRPSPYCLYSQGSSGYFPPTGNCIPYVANEWMTFQVHVKIGTWYLNDGNYHRDSAVELWVAREGQPSQLAISFQNYDLANNNPDAKYGKIWLLPYNTGKDSSAAYPTAYTWYDELIISRSKIADPSSSSGGSTSDTTPPTLSGIGSSNVTASGATISWTTNEASDSQVEYGTTTSYGTVTPLNTAMVTSHSMSLSGLPAGTTYNYRVKSKDASGNLATSGNFTFTTSAAADTTAPVLSSITSSNTTTSSDTISWSTNEMSDSQVEYGTTTAYGTVTPLNTALVMSHSMNLSSLAAGTTYNYRVRSKDSAGNLATSSNFTFTTSASSGGGTIEIFPGTDVFGPAIQSLKAGNTLIVHQGTYYETTRMSVQVVGTAGTPILVTGAAGEAKPVITRPSNASLQNTINIEGSTSYLTLRGLEIVGNGGDGITMSGTLSYITLEDLSIHDVDVGINFRSTMHDIAVHRNHVYNTGALSGTGEGMYVGCNDATCIVSNSVIEQNWIHDTLPGTTQGDGIEVKVGSHSNVIRDNVVYNRPYPCIFVYGTGANPVNVVEGNVAWNCLEGIYAVADAIVRNNIVFGSGTGLSLYPHSQVATMKNITAVNNTLYNNDDGVYMRWGSSASNMILANNAVYSPTSNALNLSGSVGTFVANYVNGGTDRSLDGTQFINGGLATSAFVNPDGRDFWPKSGSPLIGTASSVYAPAADFNGTARTAPQDVGAYETNGLLSNPGWAITEGFKVTSTTPPPSDTTPPTISAVSVSNITASGATITWTTNEPADSQTEYGLSTSYGSQVSDTTLVTSHSQVLSGLLAGTLYDFRVKSKDASGNLAVSTNFTFTTPTNTPPPPPSTNGLVGYWAFNEGAGLSTVDGSGNGNTGTLSNNPQWITGVSGTALQFNATDNNNDNDDPRVIIGRNFDVAQLPLTITAWINPAGFTDWRAIFSKRDSYSAANMRFDVGLRKGSGRIYIDSYNTTINFNYTPPVNTWTHIAIVASSTGTRLYVNGVLKQRLGAVVLGAGATANTVIGGTGEGIGGDNDPFKGSIDEVRVYNRALSDAEVQQIYSLN